jgi:hypothetical protein
VATSDVTPDMNRYTGPHTTGELPAALVLAKGEVSGEESRLGRYVSTVGEHQIYVRRRFADLTIACSPDRSDAGHPGGVSSTAFNGAQWTSTSVNVWP